MKATLAVYLLLCEQPALTRAPHHGQGLRVAVRFVWGDYSAALSGTMTAATGDYAGASVSHGGSGWMQRACSAGCWPRAVLSGQGAALAPCAVGHGMPHAPQRLQQISACQAYVHRK